MDNIAHIISNNLSCNIEEDHKQYDEYLTNDCKDNMQTKIKKYLDKPNKIF